MKKLAMIQTFLDFRNVSFICTVFLLAFPFSPPGYASSSQQPAPPETSQVEPEALPQTITGPYRTVVGDVLEISFFNTSELDQTRTIGPDGEISLMLIGPLKAAGRTIEELTAEVTDRYSRELVDPDITLSVQEFAGLRIYVGGEVNQPGMFDYRGGVTLVQAVMDAGGFLPSARLTEVVLIRKGPESRPVGSVVDVKQILYKAQFANDLPLAPSDIIFVPRSKIANVNLWVDQYIRQNIPFNLFLGFYPVGR